MRKHWNIVAAIGVFILIALVACKNDSKGGSSDAVPTAVADTAIGFKGADRCNFKPLSAHTFDLTYQHYTVRIVERGDTAGVALEVAPHRGGPKYNVPVPNAAYFAGINRDFMYVDAGTGPSKREVIIYQLSGQKEIYRKEYLDSIQIMSNGKMWYWEPIVFDSIPEKNRPECAEKADWESKGLFVQYGKRAVFDPNTLVEVRKSEYKCFATQ